MPDTRKNASPDPIAPATADDPWVTVPEAARRLRIANATVRSLAARRELVSQVVAGQLFIHQDSVAEYARRREDSTAGAR